MAMIDFRRMIRLGIRQEILLRVAVCASNGADLSPPFLGEQAGLAPPCLQTGAPPESAALAKSQGDKLQKRTNPLQLSFCAPQEPLVPKQRGEAPVVRRVEGLQPVARGVEHGRHLGARAARGALQRGRVRLGVLCGGRAPPRRRGEAQEAQDTLLRALRLVLVG